ncbi:Reverse transcriptase domain-containing protein [Aphis craccivora]|uniref:Reverse transcriptase domain-containing protein n=1 Tax=Aphis craccivora TaxID=307492 RepID=A0A6G0VYU5_APHCR|nr:Reverse transcriptase domain-containing protein [Aphis craccivora]
MSTSPLKPKTRSNSSSSTSTSASTTPKTSQQLTVNDIMKAINNLKKSQTDVLASISKMSKLKTSQFTELKKNFNDLSNNLQVLQAENTSLRNELTTLKSRVESLESISKGKNNTPTSILPDMMLELTEREKCTFNFIVHNLPESCSTIPSERVTSDSKNLTNILSPLAISLPSNFKLIRLGRTQPNITRPLKVILKAKDEVLHIIWTFNTAKRSCPAIPISISRDRTLMERKLVRETYSELKEVKKGNWTS